MISRSGSLIVTLFDGVRGDIPRWTKAWVDRLGSGATTPALGAVRVAGS